MSEEDSASELRNMAEGGKKKPGCCRRHPVACGVTLLVIAVLGLAMLAVALGIHQTLRSMFTDTVDKQVELTKHSAGTKEFTSSSAPLYSKFYFFNITNYEDVLKGEIPQLVQCGPYTYREYRTKFNLSWNHDETLVNYDLNITYTYEPSMSVIGDPKDAVIRAVNIPLYIFLLKLVELEAKAESFPDLLKKAFYEVLKLIVEAFREVAHEQPMIMKLSVKDLLFGYNDPLLKNIHDIIYLFPEPLHKYAPNPFFGLENVTEVQKNNSVHTGKDDVNLAGQFYFWEGYTEIYPHGGWGTEYAKQIRGTGGFMFHPGVGRDENLTAFISELFRSGYFSYEEDKSLYGIKLYRFLLPGDELKNTSQDPGYYANGPSGVLNLTAVFEENAPVFASKPHFLDGDPGYRANVSGLHPNRSLHDSHLDVEPITGAVMRAAKRIQINLQVTENPHFEELETLLPEVMMPIFWASEEGQLTSSLANQFKSKVYGAKYGIEAAVWFSVGLGGLIFLVSSLCMFGLVVQQCSFRRRRRRSNTVAVDDERTPLYSTN